jgi:hypothetical protein
MSEGVIVADTKKPVAVDGKETGKAGAPVEGRKPSKNRQAGKRQGAGVRALRHRIASIVWLIAVVCALFLAVGALLVTLEANGGNAIVAFVKDGAHVLDLGVFSPKHGPLTPGNDPNLVKASLANWGLGAVGYLVVGKVLDSVIRP